jgi:hypothetical protein
MYIRNRMRVYVSMCTIPPGGDMLTGGEDPEALLWHLQLNPRAQLDDCVCVYAFAFIGGAYFP